MKPDASSISNPFPADAVATFSTARITCDKLGYMVEAHKELSRYLADYPRDDTRFGGAIGLRGGHGSGKTHVLAWLADLARNTKSIRSTVLYGKCDSSRIFDLYQQLMKQLDRSALIELIQLALLNLARAKVSSAKPTESLVKRLETAGGLQELQAEQNLDLGQIRQQLLKELQPFGSSQGLAPDLSDLDTHRPGQEKDFQSMTPPPMVRVLLDVPSPTLGVDAHRWLTGNEVTDLAAIGLTHQLRALPQDDVVDAEMIAITALEIIASLHRIAGVPLLILVDQLEVLVRTPDRAAFETLGSLMKKFIEQLGAQSAMVFIAGVNEAWSKLPRDVPARFRRREPIVVGSLSVDETRIFLESYTHSKKLEPFAEPAVATINELSGGSPREILRIAYHAFDKVNPDLTRATEGLLLDSARQSGSIGDRVKLALTTMDAVFPEFGAFGRELAIAENLVVDRVLFGEAGEVIAALVLVKATDPLDEIDSARSVQSVRQYRNEHWTRAELLVVTVGYSSAEVRNLLGSDAAPIVFNEKIFEGELRTRLVALTRKLKESTRTPVVTQPDPQLSKSLAEIATRLQQLEERRSVDASRVQERFLSQAEALAQPATEERKLVSRREVLDALDSLQAALFDGATAVEQKLVRSILVANEAYLRNAMLDDLGELYLEAVAAQRFEDDERSAMRSEREELIREMRDSLRRRTGIRALGGYPRATALVMLGLFGSFIVTGIISANSSREFRHDELFFLPYPNTFVSMLPFLFLSLFAVGGYLWVAVWSLDRLRRRRHLDRLREKIRPRGESSLISRYPQAR